MYLLYPKLTPKQQVSQDNMLITVQLITGVGLKWLTGTDITACRHKFKMPRTEAYRCAMEFLFAVLEIKRLQINFQKIKDNGMR